MRKSWADNRIWHEDVEEQEGDCYYFRYLIIVILYMYIYVTSAK